jgi:hypothetical protein
MDILLLREERTRVSEQFRAKLAALAVMRSQLAEAVPEAAHEQLIQALDKEAAFCRELGKTLLELDGSIISAETRAKANKAAVPASQMPVGAVAK